MSTLRRNQAASEAELPQLPRPSLSLLGPRLVNRSTRRALSARWTGLIR
jgi:hypothetical protein